MSSAGKKSRGGRRKRTRGTKRETSAGGVVYRTGHDGPRFLLIRDSYGHWGFPKGHVERGEGAEAAALREVREETGLREAAVRGTIATIDWFFRFRGALIHKNCQFFLMETDRQNTKPQRSEGITACRWATLAEASRLIAYENARTVLRRAHDMITAEIGRTSRAAPPASVRPARAG